MENEENSEIKRDLQQRPNKDCNQHIKYIYGKGCNQ